MRRIMMTLPLLSLLGACTHQARITYNPEDFINPNKVVVKNEEVKLPKAKVNATFGVGNDPAVVRAYEAFSHSGKMASINSKGFQTLAYDGHSHPIVACEPMHLCAVQLEQGELINNIDMGDTAHWLVSTAYIGMKGQGSYQITIKPKSYDIATDMIVTTNKRSYNIGLVSQKGHYSHVVNFYYPEETLSQVVTKLHDAEEVRHRVDVVSNNTKMSVEHLNFDYDIGGNNAPWRPKRVFDDGDKTFIQMPAISERLDLPVLYIRKGRQLQMVNYRYKRPYYVIDSLIDTAYLVSGVGKHQDKIIIHNRHFG